MAKNLLRYGLSLLILFAAWKGATVAFAIPVFVVPAPEHVLYTIFTESGSFLSHTESTLVNMAGGIAIGISLGVIFGTAIAYSPILHWLFEPYLVIFQSFPREALIPVVVVWLGFGREPKIFNSALLSFFPMAVITANGLVDTRTEYLELVKNWGASRWQEFRYCRFPNALQQIAGGLRIAVPLGLIGAVLGEFMGGNEGLGYVVVSSGANYRMDRSVAALVILALLGMLSHVTIHFVQNVLLAKYKQE